jgi:hypothetical protein
MNKQVFLDAAEVFDSWRVVPRAILFGYCFWVPHVTDSALMWYQRIPASERGLESAGLVGAIITAVTGMAVWVFKIYTSGGRDWDAQGTSSSTVVASTTVTK